MGQRTSLGIDEAEGEMGCRGSEASSSCRADRCGWKGKETISKEPSWFVHLVADRSQASRENLRSMVGPNKGKETKQRTFSSSSTLSVRCEGEEISDFRLVFFSLCSTGRMENEKELDQTKGRMNEMQQYGCIDGGFPLSTGSRKEVVRWKEMTAVATHLGCLVARSLTGRHEDKNRMLMCSLLFLTGNEGKYGGVYSPYSQLQLGKEVTFPFELKCSVV
ncbi:unnamed protein product [Lactuca saligna]|uniref:Uncharacterized protein n=1 Tax=Lactuca saligna TaxID=75948 RepID=A0AA36ES97_LACSI|nr:unnamed protein product [Lactuca saligna]